MLPDLSVLPFALPLEVVPPGMCAAVTPMVIADRSGAQQALQAVLGMPGILLLQRLGLQRAAEGRSEEAVGLLKTALAMLAPGFDRASLQVVLGRTLAYFDRHEQALAAFEASAKDYIYSDIDIGQIEIDRLMLQRCAAQALSLCALGRTQAALTRLETGLPAELAALFSSDGSMLRIPIATFDQHQTIASGNGLRDAWCLYLLARVRVLLALHRPMDAILLLDAMPAPLAPNDALNDAPGDQAASHRDRSPLDISPLLRAAALLALHRPMLAIAPLEQRLALCAEDPAAFVLYGQALTSLAEPAFAVDRFEQALRIAPAFAPAYRYMASALVMQKLDQEALSCLRAARRIKPDWPEAWLDEAGIRLRRGELVRGFAAYEWREGARHAATHGAAYWNGDDALSGQSILILAEQGLGDTLHFIRYVPMIVAQAREVIVEVPETLQSLLSEFGHRAGFRVITPADPRPTCDRFTLLMSLPHALDTRLETIPAACPYLGIAALEQSAARGSLRAAPPNHVPRARCRIGIVPAGNPIFANDAMRSMPLSAFGPLCARNDVAAVLLQAAPREADQLWADAHPEWITQQSLDGDFSETAKVISELDLVISVDTALAHLTGAMGLPVWVLLPYVADWRWLEHRTDSPWYPSARLFRQTAPRDWDGVIQAVCLAMETKTQASLPESY